MKTTGKKSIVAAVAALFTNRFLFSALYFITAILWNFPCIGAYLNYPMKLLFVWGAAIIGWDLFTKRRMFTGYQSIWLVLFCISYTVSILLNGGQLYTGVKHMIYNGILLFVIYPVDKGKFGELFKRWAPVINDIFIVIGFVASLAAIGMFAFRISYVIQMEDMTVGQGVQYNRLYGLYTSANIGALFSALTVALSALNFCLNRDRFRRFQWFYILNAVVQLLYYSATLSNGGHVAFLCGLIMAAALWVFPAFFKHVRAVSAVLLTLVCLVASVAAFEGATFGARKVMASLPRLVQSLQVKPSFPTDDPDDPFIDDPTFDDIIFDRVEGNEDITNGRVTIWQAGLAAMKQHPLFGIVDANVYDGDTLIADLDESQLTEHNVSELKRAGGYMHNAFVQILVCAGVVGLAIFLLFAVLVGKKYLVTLVGVYKSEQYLPLSGMLSVLCILLSQTLPEAHLLFNRQDPYAILFWMYLGAAMFFVERAKQETAEAVFICDTPYQVVNAIALSRKESAADMYIYDQFSSAKSIAENLKETNAFRNVVVFRKYRLYTGIWQKIVTLFRVFAPTYTLKRHSVDKIPAGQYKRIYISYFTSFIDSVKLTNPQAECIQYEDGVGTYSVADLERYARTGLFHKINRWLLGDALSYHIRTLYLNRPECYTENTYEQVLAIPPMSDTSLWETVFDYQLNEAYRNHRCIFLTQPLVAAPGEQSAELIEQTILSAVKNQALVRVHPRQDKADYRAYTTDQIDNLWELECAKQITDEHILIGAFSTAQFTPKMLFGKEPTILFTYPLYGESLNHVRPMIEVLRTMYSDPTKIIVVETMEQLQQFLQTIGDVENT